MKEEMKVQLEELEELASKFKETELWEDLGDSDVFGVELNDGRIAYCCVMGNSGIHKGLGIYVGERGYRTYLDQVNKENAQDQKVMFEIMVTCECIQISIDDDGSIHWWSQHPHLVTEPEAITEEEMDIMCQTLKACISLRQLIDAKEGDVVSLGFDEYEEYPTKEGGKDAPLIKSEGKDYSCTITKLPAYDWSDEEQMRQMADAVVGSERFLAELSPLQGLRKIGILQCRLIHPPTPVKDCDDTPGYYPLWLLTVNKGGNIVPTRIVRLGEDMGAYDLLSSLCEGMYREGHKPLQISVPNEATEGLLKTFCQRQGIKLVRERLPLRELNKAWQAVFEHLDRDQRSDMSLN